MVLRCPQSVWYVSPAPFCVACPLHVHPRRLFHRAPQPSTLLALASSLSTSQCALLSFLRRHHEHRESLFPGSSARIRVQPSLLGHLVASRARAFLVLDIFHSAPSNTAGLTQPVSSKLTSSTSTVCSSRHLDDSVNRSNRMHRVGR
ncbi:hypothetical protein Micbo1qcDRAFT_23963 [Microdochium bolleyi]|uniref:Uncharacterized protein n=1 Tax=Microdochium bolleyi TaxID=196109 RepID=A0A136JD17_9PEZI|nr:hypothetical protein Micbo1qcDRAFT_23963 [Microdochium bolleyi]